MRRAIGLALGVAVGACGGGGGGGGGSCSPSNTASVAINKTGLSPVNVCVLPSGTVTFTNNDTVQHNIVSDTDGCPTLNLGSIDPTGGSNSKTASVPSTQQNCAFHDSTEAGSTAFKGFVAVTAATVSGGGY